MIDFLIQYITWWHWIVLGILFIILEMVTGTFIVLSFGIAAVMVGLLDLVLDIGFVSQLGAWSILSLIVIAVSFKYFKGRPVVSNTGQSNFGFDTLGTVTQTISPHQRGKVQFDTPVLGNSSWSATSDLELKVGTRITIHEVLGQLISVVPAPQSN